MYTHLRSLIFVFFVEDDVYPFKESYRRLFLLRTMYIHLRNLIVVFFVEDNVHLFKESYHRPFFC